jgi:hypothetical protein
VAFRGTGGASIGRNATEGVPYRLTGHPMRHKKRAMRDEAAYVCNACGEEIVIPLDVTAGASQEYVEDCPICCRPNVIHVEIDEDGETRVWSEAEQG